MGGNKLTLPTEEQYRTVLLLTADIWERIGQAEDHLVAALDAMNEASAYKDELRDLHMIIAGQ